MSDPRPSADEPGFHRIAIVEDHLLQRLRTQELLAAEDGLSVVATFETMPELLQWMRGLPGAQRPDLVLLDLLVERGAGVDPGWVRALVASGVQVLVLSAMASPSLVREVIRAGAAGVVGKRDPEVDIVAAVRAVLRGDAWHTPELASVLARDDRRPAFSDQEERALALYASGLTLNEVAELIGVAPSTAKTYLDRVRQKYAEAGRPVQNKLDLSREAMRDGLLPRLPRGRP